jgi:phosphatidylglycerol:prolipoprotein diacylglycerol transferase
MFPHIEIFGRDIGLYSIMTLFGIFTGGIHACMLADKRKYDYVDIIIFILFIFIGVVIGSRLLYAVVNYKNIVYMFENIGKIDTAGKFFNVLQHTFGGSVFYGGLIGGIIAGYVLIRKDNKKTMFIDIVAINIPLFHFFGRIGCFLGGCCYGIPSKIGLTYTNNPITEANGITRFPVQLLEALFNLLLFFLLNYFYNNGKFKNKLICLYLVMYAAGRFFIEFLRGDAYRGIWLFISTSQIISVLIILTVLTAVCTTKKKPNKTYTGDAVIAATKGENLA